MYPQIKKLLTPAANKSKRTPTRRANLELEMHEGREVPSVAVILPHPRVVLSGGILKVYGSSYADVITVTQHGNTISVLGKSFLASSVKGIEIRGGSGNDVITVSELITKPTCLFGDSGSDTIYGGGGSDVIYGGAGNDKLYGRGGDDVIYGGPDQDITDGGKGHNRVNQEGPSDDGVFLPQEREITCLTNVERTTGELPAFRFTAEKQDGEKISSACPDFAGHTLAEREGLSLRQTRVGPQGSLRK